MNYPLAKTQLCRSEFLFSRIPSNLRKCHLFGTVNAIIMRKTDLLAILKNIAPKQPVFFVSTRNAKQSVPFWESLVQGMADDGGLLVPARITPLHHTLLTDKKFWSSLTMSDISSILLRPFIPHDAVDDRELVAMLRLAHDFNIPLEKLDAHTWVARLDQGPTASFKDIAARALAKLLDRYCEKHGEHINIIVATSGDTGVAVADAFGNSPYVTVTVMYPTDGVSEVQEKQMLTVHHAYHNEQVIPMKGNFDTCQDIAKLIQQARGAKGGALKKLSQDIAFKLGQKLPDNTLAQMVHDITALNISSANSINIWRLLPQMTQYFASYAALVHTKTIRPGEEIVFAVPTGNVGHLMAGIYARDLGLPIKLFLAGTNANNILANVIDSGLLKHGAFTKTSSPSMDILDPSNLERLLIYVAQKDGADEHINMEQMKKDIKQPARGHDLDLKKYGVSERMLAELRAMIWVEDVETDDEVYAMMRHAAHTTHRILEPHGVTAFIATLRARAKEVITGKDTVVVFETAHPDKFPAAIAAAGIAKTNVPPHLVLQKLKKKNIASLKKSATLAPDIVRIVDQMKKLATKMRLRLT